MGPVMSVLRFSTEAQAVALDEVAQISRTLREQIEARDAAGRVRPLARGVLSRSEQLAGAVLECIQYVDEWDDEQLAAIQDLSWGAAPASRR
jgi:hypothetical protein